MNDEKVRAALESMTLEQKIGQMFMPDYRDVCEPEGEAWQAAAREMRELFIGGVILFAQNIQTEEQTKRLTAAIQGLSTIPMLISADEEGGSVSRLKALGYARVRPALEMKQDNAYFYGLKTGGELIALGINVDFAPVADINTNPNNPVIGRRAFSDRPGRACAMVADFSRALLEKGVLPVVKHFPGHGDTKEDSHKETATVFHTLSRIKAVELLPFFAGIYEGAAVMVGHISTPNITGNDEPSVFSKLLLTDLLRGEYGFDGVLFTDALDMKAVSARYSSGEAAVKAVLAGNDVLLMPENLPQAYAAVLDAVKCGQISVERINESVRRILELKFSG